tara:strand:- start:2310 stop:3473 length:1164 start_codon:yes stop_codon:yes gene_type:complete
MELEKLNFIIKNFFFESNVLNINEINLGKINKTYIVEHMYMQKKSKFILQGLANIFDSYEVLNMNHQLVVDHINNKIKNDFLSVQNRRWEIPSLIKCQANNLFIFEFEEISWRAMRYIDNTFSTDYLENDEMARQVGIGLARFHSICSDLDSSRILNSISNFHNTIYYIDQYSRTINTYNLEKLDHETKSRTILLISSLSEHVNYLESLIPYINKKLTDKKIIHGDPKLSNFLFDKSSKNVVSLIDLDTISTGSLLTDLADCIRSLCNLSREDSVNDNNVYFDINICRYFLDGYFSIENNNNVYPFRFLTEFVYLIISELTIRFLTDFLQSNKYFKIDYKNHNLSRAERQFQLLCSFLSQISNFSGMLEERGIPVSPTFVSNLRTFI